jgi:hypothetical protein
LEDESKNMLDELAATLKNELASIWDAGRKDFFRVKKTDGAEIAVPCRSKNKIEWMANRLNQNTFTSFWP